MIAKFHSKLTLSSSLLKSTKFSQQAYKEYTTIIHLAKETKLQRSQVILPS